MILFYALVCFDAFSVADAKHDRRNRPIRAVSQEDENAHEQRPTTTGVLQILLSSTRVRFLCFRSHRIVWIG